MLELPAATPIGFARYDGRLKRALRTVGNAVAPLVALARFDYRRLLDRVPRLAPASHTILLSAPPFATLILLPWLRRRGRVVVDLRDPPSNPFQSTVGNAMGLAFRALLRRYADAVVTNAPAAARGLPRARTIPTPYDAAARKTLEGERQRGAGPVTRLVYVGSIHGPRADALASLTRAIEGRGLGDRIELHLYTRSARFSAAPFVVHHPYEEDRERYRRLLRDADGLLVLQNLQGAAEQIPIKTYDYLLAGRPLLYVGSETGALPALLDAHAHALRPERLDEVTGFRELPSHRSDAFLRDYDPDRLATTARELLGLATRDEPTPGDAR